MSPLDRFLRSERPDPPDLEAIRGYARWRAPDGAELVPHPADDVEIRSYLLRLKLDGKTRVEIRRTVEALKRFYAWAKREGLIESSPFEAFDFDRPLLSPDQIRRRSARERGGREARELVRLKALNRLAEGLNRAASVEDIVQTLQREVLDVMGLHTAWTFFRAEAGLHGRLEADLPHDYALAGCRGLPDGLETDGRRFLRDPPDCMCQSLMRNGRLRRAVNVVECTRLRRAAQAAGDTGGLLFHATVPLVTRGCTLGLVNVATERWELLLPGDLQLLSAAGSQAAVALERARLFDEADARRVELERELGTARSVQRSLLPPALPDIPGFAIAAEWRAAREVAGDFYDVFPLDDGRWGLAIADVSGKGAAAALYMAMARSLLRNQGRACDGPGAALEAVNRRLIEDSSSSMYVTAFFGILDPARGALTYALAGHERPLLRRASGETEWLETSGMPLGLFERNRVETRTLRLREGDLLVAYTDGLTDSVNSGEEMFGRERLLACLDPAPDCAASVLRRLLDDVEAFSGDAPPPDDLTLLVLGAGRSG